MSEFRLQKKKTIEVKDPDGTPIREFTLDVGNYEMMKKWQSKIKEIEDLQKRLHDGEELIDDLVRLEKEIVSMTVGDWDFMWQATGENVYTMMAFIQHISSFIKEEVEAKTKAYL